MKLHAHLFGIVENPHVGHGDRILAAVDLLYSAFDFLQSGTADPASWSCDGVCHGLVIVPDRQKSGEASATETKWPGAKRRELVTHLC